MQCSVEYRRKFIWVLGAFCFLGSVIHLTDFIFLRYPELSAWQWASSYLLLMDGIVVYLVVRGRECVGATYLLVSVPQIIGYTVFREIFGNHPVLLILHGLFTIGIFYFFLCEMVVQHGEM